MEKYCQCRNCPVSAAYFHFSYTNIYIYTYMDYSK